MKNLLEFILIHLVSHPDDILVEETVTDGQNVYAISVHPEDIGRVIGKNGNIIQAIRSIAKVRAMKEHQLIRIVVKEPEVAAPAAVQEV